MSYSIQNDPYFIAAATVNKGAPIVYDVDAITKSLYLAFPDAPQPTTNNGVIYYDNVRGNDPWNFCNAIAQWIVSTAIMV